ncbi:MAG: biotin/lipoyl-containing protein [Anaerolineae bacterium]
MKYTATIGERAYEIEVGVDNAIRVNGEPHSIDFRGIDGGTLYSLLMDNRSFEVLVERCGSDQFRVSIGDEQLMVAVEDERMRKIGKGLGKVAQTGGDILIKAPMPGLVKGIPVEVWQEVKAGQGVLILEAMKMENELRAPRAGAVSDIKVKPGDKVEQGQLLVVIK